MHFQAPPTHSGPRARARRVHTVRTAEDTAASGIEDNCQTPFHPRTASSELPSIELTVDSNRTSAGTPKTADLSEELSKFMQTPPDKNTEAGVFYYSLPEREILERAKKGIHGSCSEILLDLKKDHPWTRDWPKG
jgi:hypothetical protein